MRQAPSMTSRLPLPTYLVFPPLIQLQRWRVVVEQRIVKIISLGSGSKRNWINDWFLVLVRFLLLVVCRGEVANLRTEIGQALLHRHESYVRQSEACYTIFFTLPEVSISSCSADSVTLQIKWLRTMNSVDCVTPTRVSKKIWMTSHKKENCLRRYNPPIFIYPTCWSLWSVWTRLS